MPILGPIGRAVCVAELIFDFLELTVSYAGGAQKGEAPPRASLCPLQQRRLLTPHE